MTITSDLSRVRYLGNGVSTIFAINFPYLTNKDGTAQIAVYVGDSDTPLEEGKDYTVNGFGKYSDYSEQSDEGLITYETRYEGGEVVFYDPPIAQIPVAIVRNVPQTQGVVFVEGEDFPAQDFENALDKLTMEVQEVKENLQRAIVLPPTSTEKPIEIRDNIIQTANEAQETVKAAIELIEEAPVVIKQETDASINAIQLFTEEVQENISKGIDKAQIWAEGTQAEVEDLGGTNSSKGYAEFAQAITNTPEDVPVSGLSGEGDNIYSTYHYSKKTKEDRTAIEELIPEVMAASKKAVWGNIGDIKYTARTSVPNGGFWCDGQVMSRNDLKEVYDMLVNGELLAVTMDVYNAAVELNGSCGFFGLDTVSQTFRLPLLDDIYIKSGQEALEFGSESLPNITGIESFGDRRFNTGTSTPTGAFYHTTTSGSQSYSGTVGATTNSALGFDASRSSSTYKSNAKVNPDHVTYRAYVILYYEEKEVSIVDWTNQLKNLAEQLKEELIDYGAITITYWE